MDLCFCELNSVELLDSGSLCTGKQTGRGGRQHDDGQWFSQSRPFHIHIYSAFFDNRTSLRFQPQVALIGVVDRRLVENRRLWCHVWYGAVDDADVLRARAVPAGAGSRVASGSELVEHVITCLVSTDKCAPVSVSLAWGTSVSERTTYRVPVELSQSSPQRQNLAVCVSVSFGQLDVRRLTEWLDMQQILGAQLVVIYNHSLSQSAGRLLWHYADAASTNVELRQTRSFISNNDVLMHMSPVINDCLYRFSGRFRYFAVIDLDELIVPRHFDTVPALIKSLSSTYDRVSTFVFRNAYFFLDIPVDDIERPARARSALSTYLVHRRRLAPSPPAYAVKSVVDAEACIAMHNHYCWSYTADALSYWTLRLDVQPSDALLHHYKRCHLDGYLQQPGHCKSVMAMTVVDDVINKYTGALLDRLYMSYVRLNLTTAF